MPGSDLQCMFDILNINHTFRNMIILPWVRRSVLRGNLYKVWEMFCGILVLHTESVIRLVDLCPKSQRIYVGHIGQISFVSRGLLPVNSDLNLCVFPELFRIGFCILICYIYKCFWPEFIAKNLAFHLCDHFLFNSLNLCICFFMIKIS